MSLFNLKNLSLFLKYCLEITFCLGLIVTIFLPWIIKKYFPWYFIDDERYYWYCLSTFILSGLSALGILNQLLSIIKTINNDNPFVYKNAKCLKNISVFALIISLLFFILLFARATILTFVVGYIFLVASLACLVFAKLFYKAVEYKSENDLTI